MSTIFTYEVRDKQGNTVEKFRRVIKVRGGLQYDETYIWNEKTATWTRDDKYFIPYGYGYRLKLVSMKEEQ